MAAEEAAREPFKEIFNAAAVRALAERLAPHAPGFDPAAFAAAIVPGLEPLALLQRVDLITRTLKAHLPDDYAAAVAILLRAMGPDDGGNPLEGTAGFRHLPCIHYVGLYGLGDYELSVATLREMTKRFSAEWDIRPYLAAEPERTLRHLADFARDPDPRVRRLVSEGTRPRLPWATRLPAFIRDPGPVLALLELLKDDPDLVVRRSVANNLNDISKDHPDRAVAVCAEWWRDATAERRWIVRHALRSLVKAGHPGALALLGYGGAPAVSLEAFALAAPSVPFGGTLGFALTLRNTGDAAVDLVIDYALHFRKANGRTAPKVFKLTTRRLAPGEACRIERRHPIRPITTRRYYDGEQAVEILVNGKALARLPFVLTGAG